MSRNRVFPRVSRVFFVLLAALLTAGPPARATWLFSAPSNLVTLDSGKRNNVFYVGDPVVFTLTGAAAVRYEVRDYYGTVVDSGTAASPLTLHVSLPGWYKLYLHGAASQPVFGDSVGGTTFVIFRPNPNFPLEPSPALTGNSGAADGDQVARGVTGMGPQRHPVTDASNPAQAIALLDPSLALDKQYYTPYDLSRPRPLLIAFPNGVASSDPVQQSKNLAGLRQLVTRYHTDVKYWEPLNEPNFVYTGADYVNKELKPFYQTVKGVDPTCKVLGPGVVTIGPTGLSWIEDFLQAGGAKYMDAFSFHAYNNVNGDLTLVRRSLDSLNALLAAYGVGNIEKWQTEQGYFAAVYGSYQPRLQGRWTMLQMMAFEQYGIPKEHNHLWYDTSHGFWSVPAFWENADGPGGLGGFNPAAPLMRVWSEELCGTNFAAAYDFGPLGSKMYLGSLFSGPGRQVAAFMSAGRTDGNITLNVSGGASVHVVSAFGVAQDLPLVGGQVTLPVPELPVYVELAAGQTVQPAPINFGADLALTPGTTASASGTGLSALNPAFPNPLSNIINGALENWYWGQGVGDHSWMDNTAGFPAWVQVTLPGPMPINHAVIYADIPWQNDGSLLDYEFQYDANGQWVTVDHVQEPSLTFPCVSPATATTVDSFYSDRSVFEEDFPTVTTQKIRLLVHDTTCGGGATPLVAQAGGQTGPHQITLREIELYNDAGSAKTPTASASFVGTDTITQGNWKGVYGKQGYSIIGDSAGLPAYAAVTASGQSAYTWAASTPDPRALQKPASATDRLAACWYSAAPFTVDVNLTDGQAHQISVYCLDWDTSKRIQKIDILDAATGTVLSSQSLAAFSSGAYLSWKIQGHVQIKMTVLSSYNAVLSGLFFDAPAAPPISGQVSLQGWAGTGAMPALVGTLTPTGTTTGAVLTQTVTPAADGSFTLNGVPAGTYTLGLQGSQWLKKNVPVDTTGGSVSGLSVALRGGDANGDNQVNGYDYLILRKAYGTSLGDTLYDARADFNGDGQVNGTDYLILRKNFGTNGD